MKRTAPLITRDDQFFWDGVAAGELRLQRCARCNRMRHPPAPVCPFCHSLDWRVDRASGRGTLYSYVIPRHTPIESGGDPVVVALIELEEGARLVSNLSGAAIDEIRNGMPVEVFFADFENGLRLHQFRPARR